MPKPFQKVNWSYLGIDPGKNGGIAIFSKLSSGRTTIQAWPMLETELDLCRLLEGVNLPDRTTAVIEHVWSSPQMGVASSFTFGFGYGGLRMVLTALRIPFSPVRPQVWQNALGVTPQKKGKIVTKPPKKPGSKPRKERVGAESSREFKERLRAKSQQLFPDFPLWQEPKTKTKQMAICDAMLIAYYCSLQGANR